MAQMNLRRKQCGIIINIKENLSIRIAERLILKLFAGVSNIKKEYITKGVIEYHKSQGGSDEQKTDPTHIACQALGKLKCYGYAENIRYGYWNILVIYDNDGSDKK